MSENDERPTGDERVPPTDTARRDAHPRGLLARARGRTVAWADACVEGCRRGAGRAAGRLRVLTRSAWGAVRRRGRRRRASGAGAGAGGREPGRSLLPWLVLAAVACTVLYGLRHWLFSVGILHGDETMRLTSLGLSTFLLTAVLPLAVLWRRRRSSADGPAESTPVLVATVTGLAVTLFTLTETFAPNTPEGALAAACRNAPVYGAPHTVMTGEQGVSVREGPGRHFEQTGRYGPECSVGVEGMCLGEPWTDLWLGTSDQRWFSVHNREEYLPAGAVITQGAELDVGVVPSAGCEEFAGKIEPVLRSLTLAPDVDDTGIQTLRVSAQETVSVGFSYLTPDMLAPRQIVDMATGAPAAEPQGAQMPVEQGFATPWPTTETRRILGADTRLTLAAVPCLAGNVPYADAALFFRVRLTEEGAEVVEPLDGVSDADEERLVHMACARSSGTPPAEVPQEGAAQTEDVA